MAIGGITIGVSDEQFGDAVTGDDRQRVMDGVQARLKSQFSEAQVFVWPGDGSVHTVADTDEEAATVHAMVNEYFNT